MLAAYESRRSTAFADLRDEGLGDPVGVGGDGLAHDETRACSHVPLRADDLARLRRQASAGRCSNQSHLVVGLSSTFRPILSNASAGSRALAVAAVARRSPRPTAGLASPCRRGRAAPLG